MSKKTEDLIREKLDRLENIPLDYITNVEREQKKILRSILELLDEIERENGVVVLNDRNIDILSEIDNKIVKVIQGSDYKRFTNEFIKEFDVQLNINNFYISEVIKNVVLPKESEIIVHLYKESAFNDLFGKNSLLQTIAKPVHNELKKTIASEGSFIDLTENIRTLIVGDSEVQGKLKTYAGQIAWDSFATSDRAYTKQISDANDIQFYRYAGGLVEDSRSFCIHRNNKYFHIKEIEKWGENKEYNESKEKFVSIKEWKGKIDGTNKQNIFTNLGGYRCLHSLIPVPLSAVPKEYLKHAEKLGFLKVTEKQRQILGI